ncbi:hypothetical protein JCGZ_17347 [Jatropha curcas]|uniref:CCT domain-containing protein n=1 Tax=Jatropha curcas TaxID=180498 RepID=A0A067LLV7_JATCU|nr:protein CHLOROPLAST IMPORT APPARATUS 2 [Jatropha curcas]KDP45740.1 hypothetical protein JCGZ_17347 [Jatropha curcas]
MRCNSSRLSPLKSPKKEGLEIPEDYGGREIDAMDDLQGILSIEDEENTCIPKDENGYGYGLLSWDFMELDEQINGEDGDGGCYYYNKFDKVNSFFEEDYRDSSNNNMINRECIGFSLDNVDEEEEEEDGIIIINNEKKKKESVSLNLNLNYQEVLDAWSDRGSLWANDCSASMATSNTYYMGEVPVMEEEKTRREASVMRYKEKRQTRLFSKKIRYQVRKLNADKRPRLKGRFVKRVS